MDFADVVRLRHMTRRYDKTRPVLRSDIDEFIDAGLRAPSAGFSQGWHFLVLDRPASVQRYWDATTAADRAQDAWLRGLRSAPALVVVYSERARYAARYLAPDKVDARAPARLEDRWPVPYWHIDAGMAALLVQLAAIDRGLGCCFFGVPSDRVAALAAAFDVPVDFTPVGVVSLGYPPEPTMTGRSGRQPRRLRSEVVSYLSFGASDTS